MMAYNATNLAQQVGIYNATPTAASVASGTEAAALRWMRRATSISKPEMALSRRPQYLTGNNYAMSVLKLATTNGIKLVDYFAPPMRFFEWRRPEPRRKRPIILPIRLEARLIPFGRRRRQNCFRLCDGPRQNGPLNGTTVPTSSFSN